MEHSKAGLVALDEAGAVLGTYYLRPNTLALGAHVANAGYVVAEHCRRRWGSGRCSSTWWCARPRSCGSVLGLRAGGRQTPLYLQ